MKINSKWGEVKVFAKTIEEEAIGQIIEFANSPLGENANIRIMPDCHAGAGCVIGTTMNITDKICPNIVGVDISCGVDLMKTDIAFEDRLEELDNIIRKYVPSGKNNQTREIPFTDAKNLRCWDHLSKSTKEGSQYALGSLGGGNHFIEAYGSGNISVHSGSRNLGYKVAEYYQTLAIKHQKERMQEIIHSELQNVQPKERQAWLKEQKERYSIKDDLAYLTGKDMDDYLHDIKIIDNFAKKNRKIMLETIITKMGGKIISHIISTHNYIDVQHMILRKGAISAQKDEILVIPLNMRDGVLLCKGKGNPDWNNSAPHGAGRIYSRRKAKEVLNIEDFKATMEGIYTTCISEDTLDESPFAYKDFQEIIDAVEPTVDILERLLPIYNFKASE